MDVCTVRAFSPKEGISKQHTVCRMQAALFISVSMDQNTLELEHTSPSVGSKKG